MDRCKLSFLRDPDVGDNAKPLEVILDDSHVFDLARDERKSVIWEEPQVQITLRQGGKVLMQKRLQLPLGHILDLLITPRRLGFWARLFGVKRANLQTEGQSPLPTGPLQTLKPDQVKQFWIGEAQSAQALQAFVNEREAYYTEENQEAEGTKEHVALSAFSESQSGSWYDHDFLETGFAASGGRLEDRFKGASSINLWAPVIRAQVPEAIWSNANAFVYLGCDTSADGSTRRQIRAPRDAIGEGVSLTYLGEITHPPSQ